MTDYDSDSSGEFVLGGLASMTMDTEEATPPPPPETTQRLETLVFQSLPVPSTDPESPYNVLVNQLASGSYLEMLESSPLIATLLNDSSDSASSALTSHDPFTSFLLSIASFNIYLQSNYTGPAIPEETVAASLKKITGKDVETNSLETQNELAVDGDLVTPVSTNLLFFALSKKLLTHLTSLPQNHLNFKTLDIWSLRLHKCHFSLLQLDSQPPPPFSMGIYSKVEPVIERLTKLVASTISRGSITSTVTYFTDSIFSTLPPKSSSDRVFLSTVSLELGLVSQMFEQNNLGKPFFNLAAKWSGLKWSVTGREGKKTKFQEKAIAMMVVLAESELEEMKVEESMKVVDNEAPSTASHEENNHLLERTQFTDSTVNTQKPLTKLDQSILLAFCLDVKNDNPADGLTSEQMSPFLERVLLSHDSWMIYSTALLERAWLECETSNRRERAIIQIQALVDQHGNRLTITQSTFKAAIEDSAPPQVRLENVHGIVYPPRWGIKKDLGERYAKMGIVSTAAEIFEEIHLWDEVVECLKHAGKKDKAKLIVEKQLKKRETPRMWAAMGDLTDDAQYYVKAWDLSGGKYARAKAAIGRMEFDKGNLRACYDHMLVATEVKPLTPSAWFLLGTCSMRLDEWGTALKSFSNVVTQRPDDCDAWANVAAIHIHNKAPASAYPALNESLKQRRNNWRVWINKLYVCMDLGKIDEAIQVRSREERSDELGMRQLRSQ
ncbi:hypothetical protein TL16_g09739 [Triparma laevis f. inornata]|uniref:Uncharacterized protein n=1 Tax=Triparma laevis f. inornata TaxID=1714386 RepID=A0A9W7BC83_9STRA|nr:hypothetical protein TL16_g09739 [Triparma laevis f. inornata]